MNFQISSNQAVSKLFVQQGAYTFEGACAYIKQLPYRRNKNKEELATVFSDGYGTCSTKHALLKQLAIENGADQLKLKLGIFRMNQLNTPAIAATLEKFQLEYIPEAHNYLRVDEQIIDCTNKHSSAADFVGELLTEIEIQPTQITDFKVQFHKAFLAKWLTENPAIPYSLEEFFAIRELCIQDLQA